MFDTITLDNEKVALKHMKRLIETDGRLTVRQSFSDASEALAYCMKHHVAFVFADIEMPHMDGLIFGRELKKECPHTKLVYVTAYSQYALEAYNNYAVGYLLKPVAAEKVSALLDQFIEQPEKSKITVYSLGSVSVVFNGQPVKFRTNKAKELFYYLLCKRGRLVSIGTIIEDLWYDDDVAFAKKQLHNNLYHLRCALKPYGLSKNIQYELGAYGLAEENIVWDYAALENELDKHGSRFVSEEELLYIDEMNKGMCFEDSDYLWAASLQSHLEIKLQKFYETQLNNPILAQPGSEKILNVLKAKCKNYDE